MITINVKGVGKVKVEKKFLDLPKSEQQKILKKIKLKKQLETEEVNDATIGDYARSFGQGLSLGFGDEIEAGLKTGFGFLGDYDKTVGDIRSDIKDFRRQNPYYALGTEIAGGALTGGLGTAKVAGLA